MRKPLATTILLSAAMAAFLNPLAMAEIPPTLSTSEPVQIHPIWVSAQAAVDSDGKANAQLFNEDDARVIQSFMDTVPGLKGCVELQNFYAGGVNSEDRSTLTKAARTSKVILTGKIQSREFGFYGPTPGQLLEVRPEQFLAGRLPDQSYYFFIPVGHFRVGETEICKTDTRWAEQPSVDDDVVLLVPRLTASVEHGKRLSSDQFLYLDQAESLVVIKPSARAFAAKAERNEKFMEAQTKKEVIHTISSALKGGK